MLFPFGGGKKPFLMNTARGTAALTRCLQPGLVFGGRVPGSPGEPGGTAGGCGESRGAPGSGEEPRGAPGPAEGAERPREAARGRGRGAGGAGLCRGLRAGVLQPRFPRRERCPLRNGSRPLFRDG